MQPSSAFMERVFSILRTCMDERRDSSYSDRIAVSALLKYNRGRRKIVIRRAGETVSPLFLIFCFPLRLEVSLLFSTLKLRRRCAMRREVGSWVSNVMKNVFLRTGPLLF